MKRVFAVFAALMLAAPIVWSVETMAQTKMPPASPPGSTVPGAEKPRAPEMQKEQEVQGKIKSVDPSGVTLEDGTKLMIPDKIKVKRDALKEGMTVKVRYKEEGGQKVVTRIDVQPEKKEKKS